MLLIMKSIPKYNTFYSKKFKDIAIKFAKVGLDVNNSDLYPTKEYKNRKLITIYYNNTLLFTVIISCSTSFSS